MIRETNLLRYLPPFMQEFKEISETLNAEEPEFVLVWKAADRVLQNKFISTADEYGIARFEAILGILFSREDDLESRRLRVMARWYSTLPYTLRALIEKLVILCGPDGFTITKNYDYYEMIIDTALEMFGKVEELERQILLMVPCNIIPTVRNRIICNAEGNIWVTGGVRATEFFFVTNDFYEEHTIPSSASVGSGVLVSEIIGA